MDGSGWILEGGMGREPVVEPRRREAESEKITINLGYVDLGRIDLLVQEGFYSNRTDLIRTAIRNQLATHGDVPSDSRATRWRRGSALWAQDLGAEARCRRTNLYPGVGLASITMDVLAKLARETHRLDLGARCAARQFCLLGLVPSHPLNQLTS